MPKTKEREIEKGFPRLASFFFSREREMERPRKKKKTQHPGSSMVSFQGIPETGRVSLSGRHGAPQQRGGLARGPRSRVCWDSSPPNVELGVEVVLLLKRHEKGVALKRRQPQEKSLSPKKRHPNMERNPKVPSLVLQAEGLLDPLSRL